MPITTDALSTGFCSGVKITVLHADVTESSRTLCRNHLNGPAASCALGEALAAAVLLSVDAEPETDVVLRMTVNGPLQGLCVEAAADGSLRGYTHRKVIPELDELDNLQPHDILGNAANVQIAFTRRNRPLRHASFEMRGELSLSAVLMQYYMESVQRPALLHVASSLYGGYLNFARAFQINPTPDTPPDEIARLQTRFLDGSVAENLDACLSLADLCAALELPPPECSPPKPLKFFCACSRDRVANMLTRLSVNDLRDLLSRNTPTDIYCHMCGRGFSIPLNEIQRLIDETS